MMRTKLAAVLAATAMVTLAACGGTSGSPTAADQSTSAGETTSQSAADGGTSSDADATAAGSDTGAATDTTSEGATSDTGEGDLSTITGATDTGTTSAGNAGGLDGQSAAWFSAACTGMKPTMDAVLAMLGAGMAGTTSGQSTDAKALQQTVVAALKKAGKSMGGLADNLAVLPAPTIDHGAELAKQAIGALKAAGPQFEKAANAVAAEKVTDAKSLTAAMSKADSAMSDSEALDSELLDALVGGEQTKNVSAETAKAIASLPACSALNIAAGAGAAPTTN